MPLVPRIVLLAVERGERRQHRPTCDTSRSNGELIWTSANGERAEPGPGRCFCGLLAAAADPRQPAQHGDDCRRDGVLSR